MTQPPAGAASATGVGIFVCCHAGDLFLTKVLCESIRYFCPTSTIVLIKDGDFPIGELRALGRIAELDESWVPRSLRRLSGWGLRKLLAFFQTEFSRFLYLDSDIVLLRDPFELPFASADFYVDTSGSRPIASAHRRAETGGELPPWPIRHTFDPERVRVFDPSFSLAAVKLFNSGQIFGRSGLLDQAAVLECVARWQAADGTFACADQGILNYLLNEGAQRQRFTLGGERFRITGFESPEDHPGLTIDAVLSRRYRERTLIHWAGVRDWRPGRYPFSALHQEFRARYYGRFGPWVRWRDDAAVTWRRYRRRLSNAVGHLRRPR